MKYSYFNLEFFLILLLENTQKPSWGSYHPLHSFSWCRIPSHCWCQNGGKVSLSHCVCVCVCVCVCIMWICICIIPCISLWIYIHISCTWINVIVWSFFCIRLHRIGDQNELDEPHVVDYKPFNPKDGSKKKGSARDSQLLLSLNWVKNAEGMQVRIYLFHSIHLHMFVPPPPKIEKYITQKKNILLF